MPGIDDAGDLPSEVLANPGKLRQVGAGREHASHALGQTFDYACRATIGTHTKWVPPLDFKKFRGLIEHCRNFSILHRHGSQPHKVALRTADDLQSLLASSPSRKPEQLVHPPSSSMTLRAMIALSKRHSLTCIKGDLAKVD